MAEGANIYGKLMAARIKLQSMNIKKSGKNTFANYDYFELGDFLMPINQIFSDLGLCSMVTYDSEMARLTIVNVDKPEESVVFSSPMAAAALKGAHEIQQLGAVQTYQRRYLYMAALEIVEHDAIDGSDRPEPVTKDTTTKAPPRTRNQKPPAPNLELQKKHATLFGYLRDIHDFDKAEYHEFSKWRFNASPENVDFNTLSPVANVALAAKKDPESAEVILRIVNLWIDYKDAAAASEMQGSFSDLAPDAKAF